VGAVWLWVFVTTFFPFGDWFVRGFFSGHRFDSHFQYLLFPFPSTLFVFRCLRGINNLDGFRRSIKMQWIKLRRGHMSKTFKDKSKERNIHSPQLWNFWSFLEKARGKMWPSFSLTWKIFVSWMVSPTWISIEPARLHHHPFFYLLMLREQLQAYKWTDNWYFPINTVHLFLKFERLLTYSYWRNDSNER